MLELARALRSQECEPVMLCPGHGILAERAGAEGIPVLAVAKRGAIDWRAVRQVSRRLQDNSLDLLHTHNGRTSLIAAMAVCLAGRGHVIATQHFIDPSRSRRTGIKGFVSSLAHRWVEGRVDHHIAISQAVRDAMLGRGDSQARKITVVPNGITAPQIDAESGPQCLRLELGISDDSLLIVCAARLESEKDVASLVEAMAIVRRRHPQAVCVVAGEGSQRSALERRIADLGLDGGVRLLGFRNDVATIVSAADLFVLPSVAEPFGLVILEAMSLGKPVIATAAGGPLEIVVQGQTGLLVPPANPVALADAIGQLATDAELRRRMGLAGQQRFAARYTAGRMAAETAAVYRQVLALDSNDSRATAGMISHEAPLETASNVSR